MPRAVTYACARRVELTITTPRTQYAGRDAFGARSPSSTPIHDAVQSDSSSSPLSRTTGSLHALSPRSVHTCTRTSTRRRDRSNTGTST